MVIINLEQCVYSYNRTQGWCLSIQQKLNVDGFQYGITGLPLRDHFAIEGLRRGLRTSLPIIELISARDVMLPSSVTGLVTAKEAEGD